MTYFFNGFFAGLVTGGSCLLIQAWPTTAIKNEEAVAHQTGYFAGLTVGLISMVCCVVYLVRSR